MDLSVSGPPPARSEGLPPPHRKQKRTSVTAVTSVIHDCGRAVRWAGRAAAAAGSGGGRGRARGRVRGRGLEVEIEDEAESEVSGGA